MTLSFKGRPILPGTAAGDVLVTRQGFNGPYSILYYRVPPTDEFEVESLALPGFCPFELVGKVAVGNTLDRNIVRQ